jgi:hypothetical protein
MLVRGVEVEEIWEHTRLKLNIISQKFGENLMLHFPAFPQQNKCHASKKYRSDPYLPLDLSRSFTSFQLVSPYSQFVSFASRNP